MNVEVASHPSVVEDPDRSPRQHRVGEQPKRHVRATPGAIDREEAQPGRRQVVEMAVAVRHQLVRLLGGGVEADGMIDVLLDRERHRRHRAVDRTRGGVDEMAHARVPAAFQHVEEAVEVAGGIGSGIVQRVAHPRAGQRDGLTKSKRSAANSASMPAASARSSWWKLKRG